MRTRRSSASARPTQPRSDAITIVITPNPVPPEVHGAGSAGGPDSMRSYASPLTGWAKSQK